MLAIPAGPIDHSVWAAALAALGGNAGGRARSLLARASQINLNDYV